MSIKLTNNNKTREDRLSFHQKALRPKILSRIPSDREGSDGDIMLGHTSDGDKLFAKINGKWVTFDTEKRERFKGKIHVIHGAFGQSIGEGSGEEYIPLVHGQTEASTAQYKQSLMLPFNCNVRKIIFRTKEPGGSTTVKLFKSNDGTELPSTLVETVTGSTTPDDTPHVFTFNGARLYEGEVIAITIDPSSYLGDSIFTLVLEYDI